MDIKITPVLCGGTLFTLLLQAAKQGVNERKKWGENTEFTERDVFESLVQVVIPTYKKTDDEENFKSIVSAYKSCNASKSGRLPIHQQANITTFNNRIENEYQIPLSAMTELVEKYIDFEGKRGWLVCALLELINKDESIRKTDILFVCENGNSIAKSNLHSLTTICLPAFLLGIWHYIIINRRDNGVGKATYDDWCKPGLSKNTREPFKSDIGGNGTWNITVTMPINTEAVEITDHDDYETSNSEQDEPYADQPDSEPTTVNQTINAPAVFFNSGANVMQINNTGTINIDRSGKS